MYEVEEERVVQGGGQVEGRVQDEEVHIEIQERVGNTGYIRYKGRGKDIYVRHRRGVIDFVLHKMSSFAIYCNSL